MEGAKDRIIELCAIIVSFLLKDVYNIDKTGLFQKAILDTTLATKALLGTKKQKVRVSLANYSNADGSDKLPLWIIRSLAQLRCFIRAYVNIASLDIIWKSNKKAQITTVIITKWLTWFNKRIYSRRVLLLLDNFSAYKAAVRTLTKNNTFKNIWVEFLPPNYTSVYQPLN